MSVEGGNLVDLSHANLVLEETCDLMSTLVVLLATIELGRSVCGGGLYFAKTYSAKSKNQYRNVVNRTLPNQESDKPYSAKPTSGIC